MIFCKVDKPTLTLRLDCQCCVSVAVFITIKRYRWCPKCQCGGGQGNLCTGSCCCTRGLPSEHPEPATPSDMYRFPLSGSSTISGKCLQIHPNLYEYTSIRSHRMAKALKMWVIKFQIFILLNYEQLGINLCGWYGLDGHRTQLITTESKAKKITYKITSNCTHHSIGMTYSKAIEYRSKYIFMHQCPTQLSTLSSRIKQQTF